MERGTSWCEPQIHAGAPKTVEKTPRIPQNGEGALSTAFFFLTREHPSSGRWSATNPKSGKWPKRQKRIPESGAVLSTRSILISNPSLLCGVWGRRVRERRYGESWPFLWGNSATAVGATSALQDPCSVSTEQRYAGGGASTCMGHVVHTAQIITSLSMGFDITQSEYAQRVNIYFSFLWKPRKYSTKCRDILGTC